jgi:hypothetical protein
MANCLTCKHNSYLSNPAITGWVSCCHPVTLQKQPRWEKGDPAWVDAMTGDRPVSQLADIGDCSAYEAKS